MALIKGDNTAQTKTGGTTADVILVYDGNDTVFGGAGDDYINGGRGNDILNGESGHDVFEIGGSGSDMGSNPAGGINSGWDTFNGGSEIDTIRILPTSGFTWTAIQIASMSSIEVLDNTSGGPGYVYFTSTIDFDPITSMNNITGIFGGTGSDTFQGGILGETVEGNGGADTIFGKKGNDILYGDSNINPLAAGTAGNDTISGGEGDDMLFGGGGNDVLDGGIGTNQSTGGTGADIYDFKESNATTTITDFSVADGDKIRISNTIADDFTDLTIVNVGGSSHVTAGSLNIVVSGVSSLTASNFLLTPIDDEGNGGPGGGPVTYTLTGGAGDDTISGSSGSDHISGLAGNDFLYGLAGTDRLFGGDGHDFLDGGTGSNESNGGLGSDTHYIGSSSTNLTIKDFNGAEGDKIVFATSIADEYSDLTIVQENGTTTKITVGGVTVKVENTPTMAAADFLFYNPFFGSGGNDTFAGGSSFDYMYGYGGNDRLDGQGGDDRLWGGDGDDSLYGGAGNDRLNGDAGADFINAGGGTDYVWGQSGSDRFYVGDAGNLNLIDFSIADGERSRFRPTSPTNLQI